jgi:spore coat polysaccharide biosynthesis predicted glycosyltransferase SpsG
MHPKYLNEVLGTLATKDYKFGDRFQRQEKQCKTLTVITEGGKEFGFGHITRCLSISRAFEKYSFKTVFIIDADDSVDSMLKKTKYYSFNWQKEFNKLKSKIKDSTYILIDSMQISDKDILNIQQINKNIIFIDDEKRRNILDFGFVVDWTVLSDEKNYFKQRKQNVTYILGSKFTPLREEFLNTKKNTINKELKSIMITLGGSDVRDLTPDILKILMIMFSKLKKNVVIGAGFTNVDIIKKYQDKNTNLIYNASAKQMAKLMQTSDLAIASGGQTLYELALIGTPCIAILLVDNAKDDTIGWDKVGAVKNIGWWEDDDMLDDLVYAISELKSQEKRQQMQDNGKKYINNNGAKLLVDKILGL